MLLQQSLALWLLLIPCFSWAVVADTNFAQCKINLSERAVKQGYSTYITKEIIGNISPIERVISLDKKQPEFTQSFQEYIKARVTPYHIKTGNKKLTQHKKLFAQLEKKYGIPRQYLVAFWGLETNFGKHKGKMSVINALSTLACDQRRSEFFTAELFDLFTLIESKKVAVENLKGSWAGAMGHMQFMPSAFLKYAVDGDNDGVVDIWHSEIDALTTAANYLNKIGWQTKERWGREVILPEHFAYNAVSFDQYFPLNHFHQLGVTKTNHKALPRYEVNAELYLPSGHKGPAFLLYPNFNVIMIWNFSKNYALSVGLLADNLFGENNLTSINKTKASKASYSTVELKNLQEKLNLLNLEAGEPDGVWGPKSRAAIRSFQLQQNLIADGYPNREVFIRIEETMLNFQTETSNTDKGD